LAGVFGVQPRLDRGHGSGHPLHLGVGGAAGVLGGGQGGFQLGAARRGGGDLCGHGFKRAGQPLQFGGGVLGHGAFAVDVGGYAGGLGLQPFDLGAGGLFGHVQSVAFQTGAVQQGGGDGVFLARGLHRVLRLQAVGLGGGGGAGRSGHGPVGLGQVAGGGFG